MRRRTDWSLDWPEAALTELAQGSVGKASRHFLQSALREVTHGRGFVLLRGLPVQRLSRERLRTLTRGGEKLLTGHSIT